MRKKVMRQLATLSLSDFEGSIDEAIKVLERLKVEHKDKPGLRLWEEREAWGDSYILVLKAEDDENDQEYAERLAQEKRVEEWQRAQYEQLKKKFGDS